MHITFSDDKTKYIFDYQQQILNLKKELSSKTKPLDKIIPKEKIDLEPVIEEAVYEEESF